MNNPNILSLTERMALLKQAEAAMTRTDGAGTLRQQVLDRVAPWYLFPGTQARPRVVGLWGMTGTGKTHFVREMVRQLGLEDSTFWLDAGQLMQNHNRMGLGFGDRLAQRFDGRPFVLVVDEFQQACNKRNGQVRDDPGSMRAFWELVDSGRLMNHMGETELSILLDLRDELAIAVAAGMQVKGGRVVEGKLHFQTMVRHRMGFNDAPDKGHREAPWVFPRNDWGWLRDLMPGPRTGTIGMQRRMEQLDTQGAVALVEGLIAGCSVPQIVDARQGLVVVLGNLDELYALGEDPLPELDPDVLLARHAELGLTGVQEALHGLFRIEQVARLGTDHFIFPPLGREALLELGRTQVAATVKRLKETLTMGITVDDGLVRHLVEHYSIAVLGARPLLNSIERCIPDLVSRCQRRAQEFGTKPHHVLLCLDGDGVLATLSLDQMQEQLHLPLPDSLRASMPRRSQVERIAVHEAAHAVLGLVEFGRRPLQVCAHTSSSEKRGFVIWPHMVQTTRLLKGELVQRLAILLGGWVAERMRYGTEGVSNGSDIAKATALAVDAVKERGFGNRPAFHAQHTASTGDVLHSGLDECDEVVRIWLDEAVSRAELILERERILHTALVDALCQQGSLNAEQLEALVVAHGNVALRGIGRRPTATKAKKVRAPKRRHVLRRP